jgi:hypothetical protein
MASAKNSNIDTDAFDMFPHLHSISYIKAAGTIKRVYFIRGGLQGQWEFYPVAGFLTSWSEKRPTGRLLTVQTLQKRARSHKVLPNGWGKYQSSTPFLPPQSVLTISLDQASADERMNRRYQEAGRIWQKH